jgi:AP-2 complex subunit alpha
MFIDFSSFSFASNHNSGSLDLLGLSTPPSQQQNNGTQNALIDVLGDIYNSSSAVNNAKKWVTHSLSVFILLSNNFRFRRFLFKNNGVLFENEMIQIGVKSEFRQNLGRLGLFYGNKTQTPLVNFQPVLQWSSEEATKLNVQIKAVDSTLDAGAQIQQMITAECIDSYSGWWLMWLMDHN